MVQLKASVNDPVKMFNLDGDDVGKGKWSLFYINKQVDDLGNVVNYSSLQIGLRNKSNPTETLQDAIIFSNYIDSSGDPYTSYESLISDMGNLVW
jgi:hypothetical protein